MSRRVSPKAPHALPRIGAPDAGTSGLLQEGRGRKRVLPVERARRPHHATAAEHLTALPVAFRLHSDLHDGGGYSRHRQGGGARVLIPENPGSSMPASSSSCRARSLPRTATASRRCASCRSATPPHTAVHGEQITLHPGNFVITPARTWRDHGNIKSKPRSCDCASLKSIR
jgi:hypothetical protein